MTHYTVLVKYESEELNPAELDKLLEPYSEDKEVEPYKKYVEGDSLEQMKKCYKLKKLEDLVAKIKNWSGCAGGIDEKGLFYWSTYNPKSKWDWWSLGGRWSGELLLKPGTGGVEGEAGAFDNETGIDMAFLKYVDFEAMKKKNYEDAVKEWEEYYKKEKTLEEYMKDVCLGLVTHSVLDENGWHEPSEMGWWGISYNETETWEQWCAKYHERWLSNPTDKTVIAVVDCHI